MDVMSPQLMWVGTRCYRVNHVSEQRYQTQDDNKPYIEEDLYEEDDRELDYDIEMKEGGKLQTSFHVPSTFFAMIIGSKGTARRRLEAETKTQIIVPKQGTEGDIVVKGTSRKAVAACRQRIELIVLGARTKQQFTHFLSVPLNSSEIKTNYSRFREKVLTELPSLFQLDESLFQRVDKLHLTLCTMSLMDNEDRSHAAQLLQECRETIIEPILADFGAVEIRVRGLEYMNDDPHAVDVLYANVESEALQQIADQMMEYFVANGLMQRKHDRVKLHVTLMNSLFRDSGDGSSGGESDGKRGTRVTFDATAILREFGHYNFGTQKVSEIHLSQRYSTACDGFYEATGMVKI
ncbi:activating signal cointegrator 1 complex subunit 1 [Toxorhynchites rutilus septentrionalis]|uniref:activating signal cointegrator 1 complex subunit 1 n=1 Tax=Toxorhynchites rutilus septentrionalis TaxID=329112 RepID=UPI00247929FD|nr:activating signal cointegrator 1 complex subunit 1 [Toxorhynchites rutilus septentrionalis]